jgi:uncharacterized membrane protein YcaP (DUF421 family)
MFVVILIGLRLLGKRGIHQLSVFELGVIIGLGSAAGDPMFYKDVGILPAIVVFIVVIAMYRLVTYLVVKNERFERLIEGKATYILKDGVILESFKHQPLGQDEFFATLRQKQVFHLGQVESVIIETDGQLSIFFYPDEKVRHGLPILPDALEECQESISEEGIYACFACGTTDQFGLSNTYSCQNCQHVKCVKALNGKRIK